MHRKLGGALTKVGAAPTALLVLAIALAGTFAAWRAVEQKTAARNAARFESRTRQTLAALDGRLQTYTLMLRAGAAHYQAAGGLTRRDWHAFAQALELDSRYPGVQGIGFSIRLAPSQVRAHEAALRAEQGPGYRVQPTTSQPEIHAIDYLEPMDWRNQRAIGFNMFAEPVRREAMTRARDSGAAAMSGKVTLVQETDTAPQAGFLIYYPVYRPGQPARTVEERRRNLVGFIYSPFRATDLFAQVFGAHVDPGVGFEIFDGPAPAKDHLLYDHDPAYEGAEPSARSPRPAFTRVEKMTFGGRTWTVYVTSLPAFERLASEQAGSLVLAGGLLIGLLLAGIAWGLATDRARADREVARRTEDILQANRALTHERNFVESLVSSVPAGIAYFTADLRLAFANQIFAEQLGRPQEAIQGRPMLEVFGPDGPAVATILTRVIETGQPVNSEGFAFHYERDGVMHVAERNVMRTPVQDAEGRVAGVVVLAIDVTERERLAKELAVQSQALATQKALTERIIANAPAVIAYIDADLVFRWNNPVHCRFLGRPAEEIIGRSALEVLPPALRPRVERLYREVLSSCEPQAVTALAVEVGPSRVSYWDVTYVPVVAEPGRADGILVLGVDVTERVAHEALQRDQIDRLREVDRLKDQFLSILSHELRTPLNAVLGFASILDDEVAGPMTPQQHGYLGKILAGTDRLLGLIDDLLDMSRIQAGKFQLSRDLTALAPLVEEVVDHLAPLADQKGQRLRAEAVAGLPPILADAQRVRQVLVNLVGNAIKFTPEGGSIEVRLRAAGEDMRIEVVDTGIGIDPADQARLFAPFTQVDASPTRAKGGTGLGLSICKALVTAHGGEIGVESRPGAGSTFWFTLPASGPQNSRYS